MAHKTGTSGNDTLNGSTEDDEIYGYAGNDLLTASSGNDWLYGGLGDDTLNGGTGLDVASYELETAGVTVDLSVSGPQNTMSAGKDTLTGIENLWGTNYDDTLIGTVGDNIFYGLAGNDSISGKGGNDSYIFGFGSGNDKITDIAGDNDRILLNALNPENFIFTIENKDNLRLTVNSSGESVFIQNGATSNTAGGIETFIFDSKTLTKAEVIKLAVIPDVVINRISNDANTSEGNALIDGSAGQSVNYSVKLTSAPVTNHSVTLNFTSSDMTEGKIITPSLTFTRANWNQPQTLTVNGIDDLENDGTIAYTLSPIVNQQKTNALEYLTLDMDTLNLANEDDEEDKPINNITKGNVGTTGVDYMKGNNVDDQLYAGYGSDEIKGGYGNDLLYGEQGEDALHGEQGNDTLWGGYQDDTLNGSEGDDRLYGEQNNDMLYGDAGQDYLDGGLGTDTMVGNEGNDTYVVDNTADVITDNGLVIDIDTVLVNIAGSTPYTYILGKNIENGELQGIADNGLTGNISNNTLTGNAGDNILMGGAGSDVLSGGVGRDILYANATADTALALSIKSRNPPSKDKLSGGDNNDTLFGSVGNDTLSGDSGNDVLDGKAGKNTLSGGSGKDVFVFTTLTGIDKITDFKVTDDSIQLENAVFTSLPAGILAATSFKAGVDIVAAVDADDYLLYNSTTGALLYDADGSVGAVAVQIALLGTNLILTNTHFLVT
jgi:Ca2+-binding RTX toxin-like protein